MKIVFLHLSSLLTVVTSLFATSLVAQDIECTADLARVQTDFCLPEQISLLTYDWGLTAETFSLKADLCTGESSDKQILITIDRSSHAWRTDAENRKIGSDQLSLAGQILDRLEESDGATTVGLVMYAADNNCSQYSAGPISMGREFPCLYVPFAAVNDPGHMATVRELLDQSRGLYADGGNHRAGDHRIPTRLIEQGSIFHDNRPGTMVMLTDGLSYTSDPDDPYGFLKAASYNSAWTDIQAEFDATPFQVLVAQPLLPTQLFGTQYGDAMATMCASLEFANTECDLIDQDDPATWPVNGLRPTQFLRELAGQDAVVSLNATDSLLARLDQRLSAGSDETPLEAKSYRINDGDLIAMSSAPSFTLTNLPLGSHSLFLILARGEAEHTLEIRYQANQSAEAYGAEMFCSSQPGGGVAPATVDPSPDLSRLQGGSASCGVIANSSSFPVGVVLLTLPFLLLLRSRWLVLFALSAFVLSGSDVLAEGQGINALHYQPVADGVGMTQKAQGPDAWRAQAGIFLDYANDVVELGGEKNRRIDSVMDDQVTGHFTGSLGLHRHMSLGIHIPFIHRSDIDRTVSQEEVKGGQLGQPGDLTLSAKFRLYRYGTFNFGIMPVATVAQGDPTLLIGDGSPNYGGHFLMNGQQGRFTWAYSLGYLQRERPLQFTDDRAESLIIRGQTITSFGAEYLILRSLAAGANLQMKFNAGQSLDLERNSPAEWQGLVKYTMMRDVVLSAGFGTGLGKGYGAPDYRVFTGVAYTPQQSKPPVRRVVSKSRRR